MNDDDAEVTYSTSCN